MSNTLIIKSALSIAQWIKSSLDNAAVDKHNLWFSSITPLPIWVEKNGIPVSLTKSVNAFPILVLFAPAPINNNGLLHFQSFLLHQRLHLFQLLDI